MLSVKWIYERDGLRIEHVFEAERVSAAFNQEDPASAVKRQFPQQLMGRDVERAVVILDGPDLVGKSFDCGTVYVMNQNGRTVASYELGPSGINSAVLPEERLAA